MDCEAEKCIGIAKAAMQSGNYDKAKRFLLKSLKIESTVEAKELLKECENNHENNKESSQNTSAGNYSPPSSSEPNSNSNAEPKQSYSNQDAKICEDIMKKTNYYEILGVEKTSSEEEIKKKYKKLALKLHPDKNHAPQATEAFKKVTQAFSCLTNKDKRKIYDEHGTEQDFRRQYHQHFQDEDEFDPEDIFDILFNGGRPRRTRRRYYRQNGQQNQHRPPEGIRSLLPMLFILIIAILMVFSRFGDFNNGYKYESAYSFSRSYSYPNRKVSKRANIQYYVGNGFEVNYKEHLSDIEDELEIRYMNVQSSGLKP